jgi:guanidinobutyrase
LVPATDELAQLLRPAGGGLFTVSTGRTAQLALQQAVYGAATPEAVEEAWRAALASIPTARVAILAIPSDCGAGLIRGAAYGPQALRQAMRGADPGFNAWAERARIVDVGDVAVIPHLLHDEMVSETQKRACRAALYPGLPLAERGALPVAPLSIAEAVVSRLLALNPALRILVLGGDHSVSWPIVAAIGRHRNQPWAIVHPDAHTDLLPERLGVKYCFATWAFHANEVLGRGGRLVQVGIRASRHDRDHWERTLDVKQFWAHEVNRLGEERALEEITLHLRAIGVRSVYFSNDIDATDAELAPSTGAAEPAGLSDQFVLALIRKLGAEFDLIGADLVEVAPPVGSAAESERTVALGARYVRASLAALVGEQP